jgi:hypothetical protein
VRAVLLVPRRSHPDRDKLWDWCRDRWTKYLPDLAIYEGRHDDGPFNRSAAINTAARLAGNWDVGLVIDADIFLRVSQVREAIKGAAAGKVTWGHRRWRGFAEDHTKRVLNPRHVIDFGPEIDRDDMDIYVERTTPRSWSCLIAIPRAIWDDMGGFDERFVGWGYEDMAFKSTVTSLYPWDLVEGDVYHLWHPRSEERIVKGEPGATASRAYVVNARLGRRYMVAAYRDYGSGDEPGEVIPVGLREKHVANLTLDDRKLALQHPWLPDWSEWWPGLDELRAGARSHRAGPPPTVTVIVTSGGTAETWPARSAYLRTALASLTGNVSGPIVQRVLYSDWPDELRPEVEAVATEFGFYVAGNGGPHGYTGMRKRMWTYLSRRAQGSLIFAAEDDFTYERPVDLEPMTRTLLDNPNLTQLALLRDAAYQSERDRGGILGWPADTFTSGGVNGMRWLEHRNFWTANPSLFRKSLTVRPWPHGSSSERLFSESIFRDRAARSAFWGQGEPWIRHIGEVRAGSGY